MHALQGWYINSIEKYSRETVKRKKRCYSEEAKTEWKGDRKGLKKKKIQVA